MEEKCCCQRLYNKMPFTRRHSASLPPETEAPSSVCGKNKYICCRHLFDEFDPKHHVQRYVRDPQATPHSIRNLVISKEQSIAVCAFHYQRCVSLSKSQVLSTSRQTVRANSEIPVHVLKTPSAFKCGHLVNKAPFRWESNPRNEDSESSAIPNLATVRLLLVPF